MLTNEKCNFIKNRKVKIAEVRRYKDIYAEAGFFDPDYFPPLGKGAQLLTFPQSDTPQTDRKTAICNKQIAVLLLTNTSYFRLLVCQKHSSFPKKIFKNELRNWLKDNQYQLKDEILFSQFNDRNLGKLCFYGPNFKYKHLKIPKFNVLVRSGLLFQVLNTWNEVKRDIILMSFWLDMKDAKIADKLGVKSRSINCNKHSTYEKIRKFLGEYDHKLGLSAFLGNSTGCRSPPLVLHFSDLKI
ncbi:hypothetical protein UNSWDHB_269 [Dehalobacter sp. UNSWDHB]|uniref:sigma-70 family RNA polymerase sigma factor n=1 Tax=Dehalobacter sp. UNSWDHB TaxID=1339256 RepID=UPI0003879F20|nr:sigma-70 family RNA polymerase sigma factor [Dehalobacter sp. UNSWDHB]EQB22417.1 hypothetical protein UNSWDHB_269 [Dehalobacter sp. UNSWDHB]